MLCYNRAPIGAPWRRSPTAAIACALLLLAGSSQAIEPSADPLVQAPPALAAAVRRVWESSPGVRAAEAKLEAARFGAEAESQPRYNPQIELELENADVDRRRLGVSQTIDWSGKRRAHTAAAAAAVVAAEAERDQARQQLALEWLGGYAGYEVATEQVKLGARRVQLLEQFAALAQRRLTAGDIPSLERDLAELALQEARAQQAELVADQAKARRSLVSVGGTTMTAPNLPAELPPDADVPLSDEEIDVLPSVRQSRAEWASAQGRIDVARRERVPDPTVSLSGGRVTDGPLSDNLVGVTVSIPIFVRNSYRAEVDAAHATAAQAEATFVERRLRAQAQVDEAATSYAALRGAWIAWIGSHASRVDDRAALLERLWEAGELSTADYLVQLKQSIDTELAANGVRARVWQAWFEWLGASGRLERWLGTASEPQH